MATKINKETFFSLLNSGLFDVDNTLECNGIVTCLWSGNKIIATLDKQNNYTYFEFNTTEITLEAK